MLPFELRDESVKGNLVLFIGAGFVRNYVNGMPLWPDLLKQVFSTLNGDPDEIFKYCDDVVDRNGNRVIPPSEYLRLAQKFELARETVNKDRRNAGQAEVRSIHGQNRRRWRAGKRRAAKIENNAVPAAARLRVHRRSIARPRALRRSPDRPGYPASRYCAPCPSCRCGGNYARPPRSS